MSLSRFLAEIKSKIVNNLTEGGVDNILSAEMGKILSKRISEQDTYLLTNSFTGNAEPISSNLSRSTLQFEKIGDGVTHNSGVFSFPNIGKWEVEFLINFFATGGSPADSPRGLLEYSTNGGSTWSLLVRGHGSDDNQSFAWGKSTINVTNADDIKIRFSVTQSASGTTVIGTDAQMRTYFNFKKLG